MTWKARFVQWLIRKRAGSDWIGAEDSHRVMDAMNRPVDGVRAWSKDRGGVHVLIACPAEDGECVAVGWDAFGKKSIVQAYAYIQGGRVVQLNGVA